MTGNSTPLSVVFVVCLTVLALATGAAVAVLISTGHGGDSGVVVAAIGPIVASIVAYVGASKSAGASQQAAAASTAASESAQAHVADQVQRLTNGGLDTAVRQTLDNIQTAAVAGGPSNAPS